MTTISLAQSEIVDRLRVNAARWDGIVAARARRLEEEAKAQVEEMELQIEKATLIAQLQELNESNIVTPVPLVFEPDGKTIRWAGGSVRLGCKPYKFVKVLYFAKKQRLKRDRIDKKVWKKEMVADRTVHVTFYELRKNLAEAKCPYEIARIKFKENITTVAHPITKTEKVIIQAEVEAYGLRAKLFF